MVSPAKGARGFTLTEAMITVAIAGILASVGPRLLTQFNRFFLLSGVRTELQRETRAAMSLISLNLRQARADTIRIDSAGGQPYYSRLSFTKVQGGTMSFYQSGTRLLFTAGAGAKTLSSNLRYLAFTVPRSDELGIVSVSMTLERTLYDGRTKALHMASEKVRVMN